MTEASFKASSSNGIWGYKPSKLNSAANTSYKSAPTTTGDTIEKTSAANSTANTYTIGLGVKADYSTKAGSYTNTFVITATGNGTPYSITYADNTSDASYPVSNLPARQYSDAGITTTSVTLTSSTPTRTGYTFKYWCEGTVSNNGTTCSGTTYNSGASYGINRQAASNTTTLYAVWSPTITIKSVDGLTNISLNGTTCTNTSTGCTITGLTYNTSYNLVATISNTDKHSFTSWSKSSTATGSGTIASSTSASTTYTVGSLPITITPTLTVRTYTCTKQYRLQNADGTWGSYTTDTTEQVAYGSTCSYSKTVTNYTGVSGTNSQAATASGTMTASGLTLQVSMYRNTYTVALTAGTGIASVAVTGTGVKSGSGTASATVYYGGAVTIAATLSSNYDWVNWTGSATYTNQSQSISSVTSNLSFTANGAVSCQTTVSGNMQDFSPCSNLAIGTTGNLTDSRDSKSYRVTKLADGKWWMTSNLNLAGGTKLDSDGSDVPSGYTQSNPYYTLPSSSTSGFSDDSTAYVYNSGRTSCGGGSPCYSYYSWLAATAGGKDSSGSSVSSDGYNAAYSICPKGWRLPTSTTSNASATTNNNWKTGDFYALATAYGANLESDYTERSSTFYNNVNGGNAAGKSPVYLLLAGYCYPGSFGNGGSYGYYWSSTSRSSTSAYGLNFYSGEASSASYYGRRLGFSVRCLLAE